MQFPKIMYPESDRPDSKMIQRDMKLHEKANHVFMERLAGPILAPLLGLYDLARTATGRSSHFSLD